MELNLKFYNGKDEYTDGDIEDKIIEYIKKYPDNYEEAFKDDSSWPVFYHLSNIRKNIISWYPFKKNSSVLEVGGGMGAITEELCQKCKSVTTIELSKRRSTAILERNKNSNNLEIIVGNFKDIILEKKYDYILLNGVLEYGALYIDSDNPYEDFLNKLKQNLNEDGKILIAIENRFGLKYWCGAHEDHTNIIYDGINNYKNGGNIKTFSKNELELLSEKCGLSANFYYVFPDYKFPEIILTDEFLENSKNINYIPYYFQKFKMFCNERELFKNIMDNGNIPFFANSYFLELSKNKEKKEVYFAKFDDFRSKKYAISTIQKKEKFYKIPKFKEGKQHLNKLLDYEELLHKHKVKTLDIKKDNIGIYTNFSNLKSLSEILKSCLMNNDFLMLKNNLNLYISFLYEHFECEVIQNDFPTIFEKYNVSIPNSLKEKMHFTKDGFYDLIFQNILIKNEDFFCFDQEWYDEYVPLEFIIYRSINTLRVNEIYNSFPINKAEMFCKFIIENTLSELGEEDLRIFEKLEEEILKNITNENIEMKTFFEYTKYDNYENKIDETIKNHELMIQKIQKLENQVDNLKNNYEELLKNFNAVINSKTWQLKNKIDKLLHRKQKLD